MFTVVKRKQVIAVILLLALLFSLPVVLYLTKKRQDIRPRALEGAANLCFSTSGSAQGDCRDTLDINVQRGEEVSVLAWAQLTRDTLKVSGVDFVVLYDKDKVEVVSVIPQTLEGGPFTDVAHLSYGESFDEQYNYLRVAQVAVKPNDQLVGGSVPLANINFRMKDGGEALVKYPDDDSYLKIVGIDVGQ